ncbi:uncharacterized protein LOC129585370 [Paramacrobiotus metropolitanus]|uniref:uncharacterized protein LOC129585370 n=1 Tax=Paramacrobiotus metropolitanus TaxID=2943436 RepID=UPI002445EDAE|nr:uncharacterized protein LOC129585370 [Paramacrobiotus metropolitanus]
MYSGMSSAFGRVFVRRMASHGGGSGPLYGVAAYRKATLNDFPIPKGSWQEAQNKRNAKGNLMMAFGTGLFVATCIYIWKVDPFQFEKVLGPYKYMKNPPAFESPVLEPNILLEHIDRVSVVGPVEGEKKKKK